MMARQYTRKINITQCTSIPDTFGGFTTQQNDLGSYWAEVKQNSSFRSKEAGINGLSGSFTFKVRNDKRFTPISENLSIVYKTQTYNINSWEFEDELERFVIITAVKQ